jgi:hypothetical protein
VKCSALTTPSWDWNPSRALFSRPHETCVPDAHAYLLSPPPALRSNQYAKTYNEVKTVGSLTSTERSQDRANVVLFYEVSLPTLVFNQAARQVSQERWHSLS